MDSLGLPGDNREGPSSQGVPVRDGPKNGLEDLLEFKKGEQPAVDKNCLNTHKSILQISHDVYNTKGEKLLHSFTR